MSNKTAEDSLALAMQAKTRKIKITIIGGTRKKTKP
jgi:hypothetical protein